MMINNRLNASNYIKYAWIIISKNNNHSSLPFEKFNYKYSKFIKSLIVNSQLTSSNLYISLYYLYKHYHQNTVLNHSINTHDYNESNSIMVYNIIISLVLCNKCLDDQSYTLKTWLIIINNSLSNHQQGQQGQEEKKLINIDLQLLNYLEGFFLSSLNYEMGFKNMNDCKEYWEIFDTDNNKKQSQPIQPVQPVQQIQIQRQEQPQVQVQVQSPDHLQGCRKRKDGYYDYSMIVGAVNSPLSINTTPIQSQTTTTTNTGLISTPINYHTSRMVHQFYSPPLTPVYKKRRGITGTMIDTQYTYLPQQLQPQPQQQQSQPVVNYNFAPQLPSSTTFNFQPQPIVPILLTQQPIQPIQPIQPQYHQLQPPASTCTLPPQYQHHLQQQQQQQRQFVYNWSN